MHEPTASPTMMSPANASASAQQGLMPMLSVFLLLLAFFILLVSMVDFDPRRTQAALGSLNATFAAQADDPTRRGEGAGMGPDGATFLLSVEIGDALKTLLRDGTYTVSTDGQLAVVRIANDAIFASGLTPAPALAALAARLRAIVAAAPSRFAYEVEVVEPLGEAGATRRAGIIVRALEGVGMPSNRLMTGLLPGKPGETRIEIYTLPLAEADGVRHLRSRVPVR